MDNIELIARQLQRETSQKGESCARLTSRTRQAEDRAYASSTIYGQAAIKQVGHKVSAKMEQRMTLIRKGSTLVDADIVYKHLANADTNVLFLLTSKVCLDVLGKESTPQVQDVTIPIGQAIQTELRLNWYFSQDKELYNKVENYFHSSTGTRQKATVFKLRFSKAGLEWDTWSRLVCHKIGAFALNCLISETGWLTKSTIPVGFNKTKTCLRYSREFIGFKEAIMAQAKDLAFCQWPMVCEPVEWSNDCRGGYLSEPIRQSMPLVRGKSTYGARKQGDMPIRMLNRLQSTGWVVHKRILDVANYAKEHSISIGKFRCDAPLDPPPKPANNPTEEELKDYKRRRRLNMDFNAQLQQKNYRTIETVYVANQFVDEECIWIPWSFGYRGRLYALVTVLSPQGTDLEKSLLYFHDEGPINEYWIAWAVATTAGLDKEPNDDRVKWTRENTDLIARIANDPIGSMPLWRDMSEPWSFLQAAFEYNDCCIDCTKPTSGLPIGIDATQSGIQHLSALTADASSGALVNLTNTPKPADGYATVAEKAKEFLDPELHQFINRKTCKRPTMTLPYGCSKDSARGYIREQLKADECDLSIPGRLTEITRAIYDKAIPSIFPGPVTVMKWIQQCAKEILTSRDVIEWTSPSGFVVTQDLRTSQATRVKTRLMGSVVYSFIGNGWGEPDRRHHVSALAPNLVHSLDASLVHLVFAYWNKPFSVIHDCVLGRACDMDEMSHDIRLHFSDIYGDDVLLDWAEQVGVTIPDGLMKNTLNINAVLQSQYFFC